MMLSFLRSAWIIFMTHLMRMARSRRMLVMALFAALPVCAGLLASLLARPDHLPEAMAHMSWFLTLMLVVPFLALISGSAVVAEEQADRTLTFVFSRPVSRAGFFMGRLLAATVCVSLLLLVSTWAAFAWPAFKPEREAGSLALAASASAGMREALIPVVLLGGVVYTTLFAAISAIVRRSMLVGVAYSMVVEGLIANLPGKTARLSIQHHLRSMLADSGTWYWDRTVSTVPAPFEPWGEAYENLIVTLVASLVIGMLVIRRKQYIVAA